MLFQSNIQENKDWNSRSFFSSLSVSPFRATSKRTRIETTLRPPASAAPWQLSEQHPREQGLKLVTRHEGLVKWLETFRATSKRTRIETQIMGPGHYNILMTFRATSKRTRIETANICLGGIFLHHFQSNIQENKDWNGYPGIRDQCWETAFRATSKRTRIETPLSRRSVYVQDAFRATSKRTRIETASLKSGTVLPSTFRATSKRTRIETKHFHDWCPIIASFFQSNIQENKDWN